MYRTHNCGELRLKNLNKEVTLSGWVQKTRNKGFLLWIDLRDRYGISQLIFDEQRTSKELFQKAKDLGREFVIQVKGTVIERASKNPNINTGEIEVLVSELIVLNKSLTPPFTIEDNSDGGEELRMQYRYLDIRRNVIKEKLIFRHKVNSEIRNYLTKLNFIDIETPYLIKSTPEGARDFIVPSRMNQGEFYALPQSPQTFKQLLMVGGIDRYFQIVKCFRDEDLRADRQPEFTQIDCEMAFVDQEEIIKTFEGLIKHLFKTEKNISFEREFPRITYQDAMKRFGSDKPDIRFGMEFNYIKDLTEGFNFKVFDDAETVIAIKVKGASNYSRKQLDGLTTWLKRPQIGAKGLIYVKCNEDNSFKSSVDKFFNQDCLTNWANKCNASKGDLILILSGKTSSTQKQMNELRLKIGKDLGLYKENEYQPVWVVDFPLLEKDEETGHYHAMHHPFTSPKIEDKSLLMENPEKVRANAYDLAINGVEVGGGSIRIHDRNLQEDVFSCLGFTKEEAESQFGFLLNAFEYGAPPHGGIAFGFDRLCALMGNQDSIRDFIAFPKNNSGRDTMIDAPSKLNKEQQEELGIELKDKD